LQVVPGFGAAARAGDRVEAVKTKTTSADNFLIPQKLIYLARFAYGK
jgi:hypothetical protein